MISLLCDSLQENCAEFEAVCIKVPKAAPAPQPSPPSAPPTPAEMPPSGSGLAETSEKVEADEDTEKEKENKGISECIQLSGYLSVHFVSICHIE